MPALKKNRVAICLLIVVLLGVVIAGYLYKNSSRKAELTSTWSTSNESNSKQIRHDDWQVVLENYLIEDESGINFFEYGEVDEEDGALLDNYLLAMQGIDPRLYSRKEQFAYWINLYNALTVRLILEHYPVESITKLGESLASFGPWDDVAITIAGQQLSLNDIEHGILRPIWKDSRIHYAVNCASIGCPNLQSTAFIGENLEALLDKGAKDYLSHPRGLLFQNNKLVLSSIFDWYGEDFGNNTEEVLKTLSMHAPESVKQKLLNYRGDIEYQYDWSLNESL